MTQCVEEIQAPEHQEDRLSQGEKEIDLPQDEGRISHAGSQLVGDGTRHFGLVELHSADAKERQNRQGEHDDAHASEPVGQAPPHEDPTWDPLDIREDRGSCGREARNRFEKGIHKRIECVGEQEGQGPPTTPAPIQPRATIAIPSR